MYDPMKCPECLRPQAPRNITQYSTSVGVIAVLPVIAVVAVVAVGAVVAVVAVVVVIAVLYVVGGLL